MNTPIKPYNAPGIPGAVDSNEAYKMVMDYYEEEAGATDGQGLGKVAVPENPAREEEGKLIL